MIRAKLRQGAWKWGLEIGLLSKAVMRLEVYHSIRDTMNNIRRTLHMALSFRHAQCPTANTLLDVHPLCFFFGGGWLLFIAVAGHNYHGVLDRAWCRVMGSKNI